MIFRYYTSDPDSPGPLNSETDQPGGHEPRLFGYAPAPKVEVRTKMATPWKPEVWEEFKPCDQCECGVGVGGLGSVVFGLGASGRRLWLAACRPHPTPYMTDSDPLPPLHRLHFGRL